MSGSLLTLTDVAGRPLLTSIETADSFGARLVGLIGRAGLDPDAGLWFPGESSIHMLFMRFAIDVAFLGRPDPNGVRRILALRQALPPWRGLAVCRGADGVLETAVGTLDRCGLRVDDEVILHQPQTV